jgi:hypothetical protein
VIVLDDVVEFFADISQMDSLSAHARQHRSGIGRECEVAHTGKKFICFRKPLDDRKTARARPQADRGWRHVERSAGWPKAQAIVGGGIADYMQADRFVRIELRTLRTHLT